VDDEDCIGGHLQWGLRGTRRKDINHALGEHYHRQQPHVLSEDGCSMGWCNELTDLDFARGRSPFFEVEKGFSTVRISDERFHQDSYHMSQSQSQAGEMA
jgi:hypothetical protein